MGLPQWLSGKESACNAGAAGDVFLIPGSERSPGGGHGNPLRSSCLENPHGQRGLGGYSPWSPKESDTTERLSAQLLYNVVLVSAAQQSESAICMHISPLF